RFGGESGGNGANDGRLGGHGVARRARVPVAATRLRAWRARGRREGMRLRALAVALVLACVLAGPAGAASRVLIDDFEDPSAWKAQPAAGVDLTIGSDKGVHGRALRLDVKFTRGSGYAVAHRAVSLDLPA